MNSCVNAIATISYISRGMELMLIGEGKVMTPEIEDAYHKALDAYEMPEEGMPDIDEIYDLTMDFLGE